MRARFHETVCRSGLAAAFLLLLVPAPPARAATTTTTTYRYNADGAPTAITTQVDDGKPSTVYLTWDNFTPDSGDPSNGTVGAGDGNLVALGATPGAAESQLRFDRYDRLSGYSAAAVDVDYAYYADGTLASSSTGGDALRFYYGSGSRPPMTNIRQADLWSAHLGPVRHLSDGTEQVLFLHRKDTLGSYDPAEKSLTPYRYDAYGKRASSAEVAHSYDIRDNPWQYAGEYRDELTGLHYLRARWYSSELPSFVSRDPQAHFNRYGYGDASPVMMVDPDGMRAAFLGELDHGLQTFVDDLSRGVQGHLIRVLFSPVLYPLQILAYPSAFWQELRHDPAADAFLGASLLAATIGGGWFGLSVAHLELVQTGIGVGQSISSGFGDFRHGSHFDAGAFAQGLESSIGAGFLHADTGLFAKNPFNLSIGEVEGFQSAARTGKLALQDNEALIFRMRDPDQQRHWTSPLLEVLRMGYYHEGLIAITKDSVLATEFYLGVQAVDVEGESARGALRLLRDEAQLPADDPSGVPRSARPVRPIDLQFELVGKFKNFSSRDFTSNPRNMKIPGESKEEMIANQRSRYQMLFNNCHRHVASILKLLRARN